MNKTLLILALFAFVSCNKTYKIPESYLVGKTFEEKGYAEDQLSPEDIKSNPDFAKSFLTSLATIQFIDKTNVNVSYWNNSQGTISSEGTYSIKNNEITINLEKLGVMFGRTCKLENAETLISNGQFERFKLKKQ